MQYGDDNDEEEEEEEERELSTNSGYNTEQYYADILPETAWFGDSVNHVAAVRFGILMGCLAVMAGCFIWKAGRGLKGTE